LARPRSAERRIVMPVEVAGDAMAVVMGNLLSSDLVEALMWVKIGARLLRTNPLLLIHTASMMDTIGWTSSRR
jgi:hypothetical protein